MTSAATAGEIARTKAKGRKGDVVPYAVYNPQDGQEPGWRAVPDGYQPRPNEYVFADPPQEGWIWDASTQSVRPRTNAETLTKAKADKETELRNAADIWYRSNIRAFEGAVVVYKASTGAVLTAAETTIRNQMNANYQTLQTKVGTVRSATTLADVQAVVW